MLSFSTQAIGCEYVRGIFREIVDKRDTSEHGSFLMAFAEALSRADEQNFQLLLPAALRLIVKYRLGVDLPAESFSA